MASMNYFDSDMSKNTNTVVYIDWKMIIYIYAGDNSSTCIFTTGKSVT